MGAKKYRRLMIKAANKTYCNLCNGMYNDYNLKIKCFVIPDSQYKLLRRFFGL